MRANIGAITDEHQFATAMVQAGAKAGFDFGEADIQEVMGASGRSPVVDELSDEQLEAVAGGRRAGDGQLQYMQVEMKKVLISGV